MRKWTLLFLVGVMELLPAFKGGFSCRTEVTNSTSLHRKRRSILKIETTTCYDELGCFSTGPPFYHSIYRPISLPPQPREVINTLFMLFTRHNRKRAVFLRAGRYKSIRKSLFNPKSTTRMIIYGLNDNLIVSTWVLRLKDTLLEKDDENVIVVDWSGSNRIPYTISVANARVVGAEVAHLIHFLQKTTGAKQDNFHIIGHSLGAQIAGYAGERLPHLGRITGLDPAGPFFRHVPDEVRLDPSDATFVDIIHTDPAPTLLRGFGTNEDVGDLDFYPGGGNPPGCKETVVRSTFEDLLTETISNVIACRHLRAYEYFQYSFNQNNCLFVGVECPTWEQFLSGGCDCGHYGERCAFMGFYSPTNVDTRGYHTGDRRMFLKVGPERPYCVHQYHVIVYLSDSTGRSYGYTNAYLDFSIEGELKRFQGHVHITINSMKKDQVHKFLISTDRHIGQVQSATVSLVAPKTVKHQTQDDVQKYYVLKDYSVSVESIRITYLYPLPKEQVSTVLCRVHQQPNLPQRPTLLSPHTCY